MDVQHPSWAALLEQAVSEPGIISSAYSQFHSYSTGNQLLAWSQCVQREIPLGPMATFVRWKELGRHVKRGEKALTLCQPVTIKKESEAGTGADSPEAEILIRFTFRPRWFVLAQTNGNALPPAEIPCWDKVRALAALDVQEIPFWSWELAGNEDSPQDRRNGLRREIGIRPRVGRQLTALFAQRHRCSVRAGQSNSPDQRKSDSCRRIGLPASPSAAVARENALAPFLVI